jgi:lambda repressor-like predicted transcriptional regulator
MDQLRKSRKRAHLHPKDWERRARVIAALSERRMTITTLASKVERSQGYVSAVIWGVDRYFSIETAIANALGSSWHELFSPEVEKVEGRAA